MKTLKIALSILVILFSIALSNWAIEYGHLEFLLLNVLFASILVCLVSNKVTQKISNLVQNLND